MLSPAKSKIERSQGTGKRWSEPSQCTSVAQLQHRMDEADTIHREAYPIVGGKTRLELFPQLRHSGHKYTRSWETRTWTVVRVQDHLSEYGATRRVCSTGHIQVYYRSHYVGKQYHGQHVQVQYDPQTHEWMVSDREGRQIRRYPAVEITREQIHRLTFRIKPCKQ